MIVRDVGEGDPDIVVIGGIHGDEPCGSRAIKTILSEDWDFDEPVKFIIANEKALEDDTRYIDTDLNRAFPGNKESNIHEKELAHKICSEISACDSILALHSTRSTSVPFSLIRGDNKESLKLLKKMPITKVVEQNSTEKGDIISRFPNSIEIECGYQKSLQAEKNAELFIKQFLNINKAINYDLPKIETRLDIFRLIEAVEKTEKVFFIGSNFEPIDEGQIYGLGENGAVYKADQKFTPILMSTRGYENIIGYKGKEIKCLI